MQTTQLFSVHNFPVKTVKGELEEEKKHEKKFSILDYLEKCAQIPLYAEISTAFIENSA